MCPGLNRGPPARLERQCEADIIPLDHTPIIRLLILEVSFRDCKQGDRVDPGHGDDSCWNLQGAYVSDLLLLSDVHRIAQSVLQPVMDSKVLRVDGTH